MKKFILLIALSVLLYSVPGYTMLTGKGTLAPAAPEWAEPERANAPLEEKLKMAERVERGVRKEGYKTTEWRVVQVPASVSIYGYNPKSGENYGCSWYVEGNPNEVLQRICILKQGKSVAPPEVAPPEVAPRRSAFEFNILPQANMLKSAKETEDLLGKKGYAYTSSVKDSRKELMLGGYDPTSGKYVQYIMYVEDPNGALRMIQARKGAAQKLKHQKALNKKQKHI